MSAFGTFHATSPSENEIARDRKMVAWLAGKVGDGVTRSCGLQAATADEVETEWENAISSKN